MRPRKSYVMPVRFAQSAHRRLAECILVKEAEDTALILVCATDLSSKCCKFVIKIYVDI